MSRSEKSKAIKIVYESIPSLWVLIVIGVLIAYVYFYIGPPQALVTGWFFFLNRFIYIVHEASKEEKT